MKNLRTLIMCLSLIIAGILFATSADASGNGSKGGDTACTTQTSPHGQPIIRCVAAGTKHDDEASTLKHHHHHRYHHHHHYYHRHYYHRYTRHGHHGGHHGHHFGGHHGGHHGHSHHSSHHGGHHH